MTYLVGAPQTYPYSAIVQVTVTYDSGLVLTGSGVVVGPNDVLTAAHLVADGSLGKALTIDIVPARNGPNTAPFGAYQAKTVDAFSVSTDIDGFLTASQASQDLAVLGLVQNIGQITNSFAMSNSFLGGATNLTGYPNIDDGTGTFDGSHMAETQGIATLDVIDPILSLDHEIHYGHSGGPLWYDNGGVPTVVGVVSTTNWSPLLSTDWSTLQAWIAGNDSVISGDTLTGTTQPDNLPGTAGNDVIVGLAGADTLSGLSGLDIIYGNQGDDVAYGNWADDTLYGGDGVDTLYGGQAADVIYGNLKSDLIYGNLADDLVMGGQGDDVIYGGQGADWLHGNRGDDLVYGNLGADTLAPGTGNDTLSGGGDTDTAFMNRESWQYSVDMVGDVITLTQAQDGTTVILGDVERLSFVDQTVSADRLRQGLDDLPGHTGTPGLVAIDQPAPGSLDFDNDADWFQVDLVVGQQYEFFVAGMAPYPAAVLYDAQGVELAVSDVGDLFYTATASGTHYLGVEDRDPSDLSLSFYELWVF